MMSGVIGIALTWTPKAWRTALATAAAATDPMVHSPTPMGTMADRSMMSTCISGVSSKFKMG